MCHGSPHNSENLCLINLYNNEASTKYWNINYLPYIVVCNHNRFCLKKVFFFSLSLITEKVQSHS